LNDGKQAKRGEEVKVEFVDNSHAVISFDGEEQKLETIEVFFDTENQRIVSATTK